MKCSKCQSENVNIQIVSETKVKTLHHGILYWIFIGWWLELLLWFFLTIPRLLIALFVPKKRKIVTTQKTMAICQSCGNTWEILPQLYCKYCNKEISENNFKCPHCSKKIKNSNKENVILILLVFFIVILVICFG